MFELSMLILIFIFWIWAFYFAPWFPTRSKDLERIYNLINPSSEDVLYDLGCGDGRIVFFFAGKGVRSRWFEISLFFYVLCVLKKIFTKNKNATFSFGDFNKKNLSDATIIYMFWLDYTINKDKSFIEKLKKELKPWTKIVSYLFEIKWLTPVMDDKVVYLYEI